MGKKTGPNPTDRAKGGTKRSLLTDAAGVPVGLVIAGANRNDFKLFAATVRSVPVRRPRPQPTARQGMCLDKGYDYAEIRRLAARFGFTLHLRTRGEDVRARRRRAGGKARRWVVERTHSWMNRFRRILIRWEKKAENYLAMLHLTCAIITSRAAGLLR